MESWHYKPARDLGMPLGQRLRSTKRESGLIGRVTQLIGATATSVFLNCYQKLNVHGRENLPAEPPFVMVSNHSSHLDALILATVLPMALRCHVFPIAAGDTFFETPTRATLSAGLINALPMWRKNVGHHAIDELRSRLVDDAATFVLFPEGTRSRTGEMARFKSGLGMLIAGTAIPVVPCFLQGAFAAWPPTQKWPRRGALIDVHIGKPIRFDSATNDRDGWRQVAADLEQAVRSLGGLSITTNPASPPGAIDSGQ